MKGAEGIGKNQAKAIWQGGSMRKLLLIGLVLIALISCELFKPNPFVGTWDADMSPLGPDPGDYITITFEDDTFIDRGQIWSTPYSMSGTYEYDDTLLRITYKGYPTDYVSYVIYEDTMVWEGFLYFYKR